MGKPVVIDFFASWCGPCKMMGPILADLKERLGDAVEIRKVDVDENMAEAQKYGLSVVPTIIIENNGVMVQRFQGVTDADTLESVLRPLL